jgi:two-component system sensor histidine kinase BaeS
VKRPGLRGRSILSSVLVAVVAVVATAVVTISTTQHTLNRERVSAEKVDHGIVDRLLRFGRTDHDWAGARGLLGQLATGGRHVVITDLDRTRLASSGASTGPLDDPTAVLDPLTEVVGEAARKIPRGSRIASLPAVLLDERPGGKAVQEILARPGSSQVCLHVATEVGLLPSDLPPPVEVVAHCHGRSFGPDAANAPAPGSGAGARLLGLNNAVARDEHACLDRRGVTSLLVVLRPPGSSQGLLTVSVPSGASGPGPAAVAAAWRDCATSSLTHALAPLVAPRALLFISQTRTTTRPLLDRIGRLRLSLALGAVLLAVVGVGLLGSRRLRRPLHGLTAATRRMAEGDLATRVKVTGSDELADLGRSFNEMAATLAYAEEQRRQMVSDISHELRTPLANIRGYLEAGRDDVLPRDHAWTDSLLEETSLLQHVIADLQVLADADAGRQLVTPDADDLVATVDLAIQSIRAQAQARDVRVERGGETAVTAPHDRLRLRQAVANLLSNAVRYAPAGSAVEVTLTGPDERDDKDQVRIVVRDHGPGIAAEHLPHVFERFYRADPSRSRDTGGSGLGLAIVERIVQSHGGTVAVADASDGGAVFTVTLPPGRTGSSSAP